MKKNLVVDVAAPACGLTMYIGDLVKTDSDRAVLEAVVGVLENAEMPAVLLANLDIGRQIAALLLDTPDEELAATEEWHVGHSA